MVNIVFLGSKKVGYGCLEYLIENEKILNAKVTHVLTNDEKIYKDANVRELAIKNNIPVLNDLDEILPISNIDILLSVQYHKILKENHINKAKQLAVNLHMAPLPEYRGCNQFTYAILNQNENFGTTLHVLNKYIDAGDILSERRFKIPENCFVDELVDLTVYESILLFREKIGEIISGKIKPIPQSSLIKERGTSLHYRNEISKLKQIDLSWSKEKINRHIRATAMPGYLPPYTLVNGRKIYLGRNSSENIPEVIDTKVLNVAFGKNVKIIKPANLYNCAIGDNSFIGPFTEIQKGAIIGKNTKVQSHSFVCELVTIGDNCFIGHHVVFINDTFHSGAPAGGDRSKWKKTIIGNNVSIGSNSTILPISICNNAVIGAGSVVTKDITEPGVYVGNPAKLLRKYEK